MPTNPRDVSRRHPNPLRHPFEDQRDATWIQCAANVILPDQTPKYRSLPYLSVLKPNFQPSNRLSREVRHPPLPLRICLAAPDQRLAATVRMEINVSDLESHELAAARESFISDAVHGALAIGSKPFACAVDKFFDVLPPQWVSLLLSPRRNR